ncbi:YceD family protein [Gemmobacter serpentinus]|uniref:YceD family protein n=1 Tax=Gemmobacter serpentinus TaxID=2652247 RepID=UPI00124C9FCB|nr:YceD family protein [Gemmobacter serpentinus]
MSDAAADQPFSQPLRIAALAARKPTRFRLESDEAQRAAIAQDLGLTALHRLSFKGELRPLRSRDWELVGDLLAEVEQPCSVTLVSVRTAISEKVERRYLADMPDPEGDEIEMPEDDSEEPLPAVVDPGAVAIEALSLSIPAYPRAPQAELGEAVYTGKGVAPLRDEDLRPFSGLASLAQKLESGQKDDG